MPQANLVHLLSDEKARRSLSLSLGNSSISIVHGVKKVYASAYQIGIKLPKQHKLSIHATIERTILEVLSLVTTASFAKSPEKLTPLEHARVLIETLKHLVRIEYELHLITEKQYISLARLLIETSKMTNGWIKYLTQTPTK